MKRTKGCSLLAASIVIEGFEKSFKDTRVAFDLLILKRRRVLIAGGNGTGKTTLLKAMAGLLHYEGRIDGAEGAFYVAENPALPAMLSVESYCALLNENLSKADIHAGLQYFSLLKKKGAALASLSKGMRQKVHLLQALLADPPLLLLDEPLSGLDEVSKDGLLSWLERLKGRCVVASHEKARFRGWERHDF